MGQITNPERPFWERPLNELDRGQWEALCDGCGKCCLHKVEDEQTGNIYPTNIACRLLDIKSAQCSNYRHRKSFVPDCMRLTIERLPEILWLPETCAYILRGADKPLPKWHYLITGSYDAMHQGGHSVSGKVVSEDHAGPIEHHLLDAPI